MENILDRISAQDIKTDPFPHVIIENFLPADVCARLMQEFPSLGTVTQNNPYTSNQRFSLSAAQALASGDVSDFWKEFITTNVSDDFLKRFLELFKPHILQELPDFEKKIASFESLRAGIRRGEGSEQANILLDAQICVNTPVVGNPTSVKIAHLDSPFELFAGLLYLRPDEDDSTGGELELYAYNTKRPVFHGQRLILDKYVKKTGRVPYKKNSLVLFLNSFNGLHGVTPRSVTPHVRQFVNFLVEVKQPLFDLAPYKETFWDKVKRRL